MIGDFNGDGQAFALFDVDGSGTIDAAELQQLAAQLGSRMSAAGDPDSFTRFRPYLAHFFPVFSRSLRVFTVSTRRF